MPVSKSEPRLSAHPALPVPARLGRFDVIDRLATGGMAEIFVASEHGLGGLERLVVLKRILPHLAVHTTFVEMFLAEARYIAQLNHPNVVQIYELGQDGNTPYIAMEYVPGASLREVLVAAVETRTRTPTGAAVSMLAQACAGAHAAHELADPSGRPLGLVHRDISPHNLMVTADGHTKLLDFGIAKATEAVALDEHTRTGALKGKVHYMAPEQCRQEPLDRRSDVFALGIVLFELLAQERLFKRDSDLESMQAIVSGELKDLRLLRPDVPEGIVAVTERALALRRDQRFATADDLRRALLEAAAQAGVRADEDAAAAFVRPLLGDKMAARRAELLNRGAEKTHASVLPQNAPTEDATLVDKRQPRTAASERPRIDQPEITSSGFAGAGGRVGAEMTTLADPQSPESVFRQERPPALPRSLLGDPVDGANATPSKATAPTVASLPAARRTSTGSGQRKQEAANAQAGLGAPARVGPAAEKPVERDPSLIPAELTDLSVRRARTTRRRFVAAAAVATVLLTVALTAVFIQRSALRGNALVFAFPATADPVLVAKDAEPLREFLEGRLHRPVAVVVATSYEELANDLLQGRAAVAAFPPLTFITMSSAHDTVVPIAMKRVDGSNGTDGILLVSDTGAVQSVADLRGKRFCYADVLSTTGYLLPRLALRKNGIDPERDLIGHISGSHVQVVRDITEGICDAGATYSGGLYAADRAGVPVARVRQLLLTGRSPNDAIVVTSAMAPAEREQLTAALLDFDAKKFRNAASAHVEKISGFAPFVASDYDEVRAAAAASKQ